MMIFQILDAKYTYDDEGYPIVKLFGSTQSGEPVTCQVAGFRPYFYARADEDQIQEAAEAIRSMDLKAEVVERFLPVGYQTKPSKMLKVIAKDPKSIRVFREKVRSVPGVRDVYETDILFKNRFLIDRKLGGMRWAKMLYPREKTSPDGVGKTKKPLGKEPIPFQSLEPIESSSEESGKKALANAPFRYLAFDIECLPLHGKMPNPQVSPVIMISLAFWPRYKGLNDLVLVGKETDCPRDDVEICRTEKNMLSRFVSIIKEYDPDVIVGYNSNGFDFPYLSERSKKLSVYAEVGRDRSSWHIRKIVNQTRVEITGRIVVDLLPLIRSSFSLKRYTLRNSSQELLGVEKYDVDPKEMERLWESEGEEFVRLVSYSRRDAFLALHLLLDLKLLDKYIALAQTSGALLQDVVNGGQTGMVENLLFRKFQERMRVVPPKPDADLSRIRQSHSAELKGGAVLPPQKGLVEDVVILDYRSLYPSIMMAHNLCYSTVIMDDRPGAENIVKSPSGGEFIAPDVSPGIVPGVLHDLLAQRTNIKKLMRTAEDEERSYLDAQQYALKILLNSFYGYSGYARARLYSLPLANAVTSFGRTNIQNTKNMVEEIKSVYVKDDQVLLHHEIGDAETAKQFDLSVVYGDTDSVFIRLKPHNPNGKKVTFQEAEMIGSKIASIVTSRLMPPMELVFESFARRGLFLVKKRYALWVFEKVNEAWRGRIKVRGMETVRRDWCELTSKTLNRCLELVLIEGKVDEAVDLAKSVIEKMQKLDLQKDPDMLEDIILTRRYTKSAASYKNKQPHVQLVEKMRARGGRVPVVGDRVPFVIVQGKGLFVDKSEDPQYVLENGLKIDTNYYIEKQILPPVLRLLSPFGITREQLVQSAEQQKLFEFESCGEKKNESWVLVHTTTRTSKQKSLFEF
ncbi:MAG: DNA-directed DNA polymerase [Methanotrichaceae archaeon]